MKTKILQEKLQIALSQAEKITGKDTTLPILGNILLKAEKNFLAITATNLETGILWKMMAKTDEDGAIVLPAQTLSGLVGSFSGGSVVIETQGMVATIISDRRKSNLNGLAAEEFPVLPINIEGEYITMRANVLCQALAQVVNFVSASSVKLEITGVYIVFSKDEVKVVATDSFRLGEKTILEQKTPKLVKNHPIIIPLRAAREIISIFGDKQKNINMFFTSNQITIDLSQEDDLDQPQIKFVSRLIEGEFPDYQAIIPSSYATSVTFSKKELLNHLKSAGFFVGKNNEVGLKIEPKNKIMEISSQSADLGGYASEVELKSVTGENLSVTFNYRFLAEGLNSIKDDECVFEFSGEDGPGVLKSTNDPSFVYIIMPIKKY